MQKLFAIVTGLLIVCLAVWIVATQNHSVRNAVTMLDNFMYDTSLNLAKPNEKHSSVTNQIVIIDIDEKSLEEGVWPWPRAKVAELVTKLRQHGVSVIAFNIVFSKKSQTIATDFLKKLEAERPNQKELTAMLNRIAYLYEEDNLLVKTVQGNDVVLGLMFNQDNYYSVGTLPQQELDLSRELEPEHTVIPTFTGYLANFTDLQQSAKHAGFVTGIVDKDGIVRQAPLLAVFKNGVYFSLALQAVKMYLNVPSTEVNFVKLGNVHAVDRIILGNRIIHTNASGMISIPYQGHAGFFQYYSAKDVLNDNIPAGILKNKLAIVGTSVPGIGDLRPIPSQSLFPSVEIQANIAAAILGNYIVYTPSWSKGAEIGLIVFIGGLLSLILPFLRAPALALALVILVTLLIFTYIWIWETKGLIFSFSVPILCVIILVTINFILGFLFASKRSEILFKTFSQYVPQEYVKKISEHPGDLSFEGESRIVTILFTDIRRFTEIAETMDAEDVKNLLNRFFTPMTEIIVKHHGTVDKYIGDMIMAFFGAPMIDKMHRQHALNAALEMQARAAFLQAEFASLNLPQIKIGIGINTGRVNLGNMGSDIRRSYTVVGDAVNIASRLESLTKFYLARIIVGENTFADNQDEYVFRHLDRIAVKGKHQPIEIYELICRRVDAEPGLFIELDYHQKALEFYYQQKWKQAYEHFKVLSQSHPKTHVYIIFLKRIEKFMLTPPNKYWDGTYIKMEK